jgi:serine/threonine-protein kinase
MTSTGKWPRRVPLLVLVGLLALSLLVGVVVVWLRGGTGIGSTKAREKDGMVTVYVPGGTFQMGSTEGESDEQPVHKVTLDSFWIDQTEVTNGQYARCVAAGKCSPPLPLSSGTRSSYYGDSQYDNYPVIYVSWDDATNYCAWAGGRLPTEAQWEYAARGPEGRVYPWGNEFDGTKLNYCDAKCLFGDVDKTADDGYADTAPVGSYPGGASWVGALDLAGNVWEWVADWYGSYPSEPQVDPTGPSSGHGRVLRGGCWINSRNSARGAFHAGNEPVNRNYGIGFRCAMSAGK